MHNMKIICMIRMNKQRCHALIKSVQEAFKKKKKSFHLFTLLRTQGASSHSFNKSFSLFFFLFQLKSMILTFDFCDSCNSPVII